ncbi:MAG: hypothetical protein AB203_03940 [Parcubacteria bacterium C7867-008]|nr:MAG: hypothetical protein AB203_03940 [Parcubacteria bacterium C7867-008]
MHDEDEMVEGEEGVIDPALIEEEEDVIDAPVIPGEDDDELDEEDPEAHGMRVQDDDEAPVTDF